MKCAECRKPIAPRDQKVAVLVRDDQGRIVAAYHRHHARRARALARTGGAVPGLVYREDRPSAYDVQRQTSEDAIVESEAEREEAVRQQEAALREHRERAEAARADEEVPERWDDWRDPVTKSLDEILEDATDPRCAVCGHDGHRDRGCQADECGCPYYSPVKP